MTRAVHIARSVGGPMRDYLGVDWADAEHAVWVEDEAGTKVLSRTVPHTVDGFAEFGRWLDERRAAERELWAAIEKPEGRIVDFLLDHGVVVFAINPKAVDRARDRFRMSGAKSDPFDARVLATFLRTDHGHLAPLRPSSEAAQELKGLTRDYTRQVRQQTRLLNQLTAALKAYYPRALEVVDDLKSRWGRDFVGAYPTSAALATLTERQWHRWARAPVARRGARPARAAPLRRAGRRPRALANLPPSPGPRRRRPRHRAQRQAGDRDVPVRLQHALARRGAPVRPALAADERVGARLLRPRPAPRPAPSPRAPRARGEVAQDHLRAVEPPGRLRRNPPPGDHGATAPAADGLRGPENA